MRAVVSRSILAGVGVSFASESPAPVSSENRLNVLFIVADDLRPEMGCFGGQAVTPYLDAFAASKGTVAFERAYVQQAICNPTRSSFLTGRRPDSTRVWDLKTQFRQSMPAGENVTTLPQYFKEQGYWTAGMGKIFHPVNYQGKTDDIMGGSWSTDYYHAGGLGNNMSLCWTEHDDDEEKFKDNLIAAHGIATLQEAAEKQPFFVAVGLHRPHLPWDVPKKYFDLYPQDVGLADHNTPPKDYNITGAQPWSWDPQSGPRHCGPLKQKTDLPEYALVEDDTAKKFRRAYFAAVSQTDANAGAVLAELDRLDLTKNTVVAFLGDHGWQLGDLGEFGKKTNFERATRSPLIIRDPRVGVHSSKPRSAANSLALVEFVDIAPTLVELAGLPTVPLCDEKTPGNWCTEGGSLQPVMTDIDGTFDWRDAAFMQYATCMHDEAGQSPDWQWHDACKAADEPRVMGYAMRTRHWRYIEWVRFDKEAAAPIWSEVLGTELYDHTGADGGVDSIENAAEAANVVAEPSLALTVATLSEQLHAGWRARHSQKSIAV